jgi:hypothetical protein
MQKNIFYLAVILFTLVSCKKNNDDSKTDTTENQLVSPKTIGKLHNEMLSYVNKNWIAISNGNRANNDTVVSLTTTEATLFNNFIHSLAPGTIDTTSISYTTIYPIVYDMNSSYNSFCAQNYPSGTSAYDVTPELYAYKRQQIMNNISTKTKPNGQPVFTNKEKDFVDSVLIRIGRIESSRDYSSFPAVFDGLESLYASQNFNSSTGEGYISSICLEIGRNSYQYWSVTNVLDNPSGDYGRIQLLPLWVGLDIVGGLAGGVGSLLGGSSWGQAGTQALVWGAAGSVPATRWFRNLFH